MTGWRIRYGLPWHRDEEGFFRYPMRSVYKRIRLSNGYTMDLSFSVCEWREERESVIHPHLVVYRGRMRRAWRKEGTPTGPGGFETWVALREHFMDGVQAAKSRLAKHPGNCTVEITGATPKLFRIYHRLCRGQRKLWSTDWEDERFWIPV